MFQFLRGNVLIAAVVLNCGVAFGQNNDTTSASANYVMEGCRATITGMEKIPPGNLVLILDAAKCYGLVDGLAYAASDLCVADHVTLGQEIRVVVKYIDDRPQRLNESFKALALEALRAAWPCKN
jgi:hypothetical protein